jgi:hypothetical protein
MTAFPTPARSRPAALPRWPVAAVVLLAAAIVLLGGALTTTGTPTHAVVWGSLALAAYAAGLLCLVGGGQGAWLGLGRWRFGPWVLLWCCAAFGLATITWAGPQTGSATQITLDSVLRGLWLVAVGMTAWTLGYLLGPGAPAKRAGDAVITALRRRSTPEVRSPLAPWILYAIGLAARVAAAVTSGLFGYVGDIQSAVTTASGYQQILGILSLLAPLAVAAAALQVYRERLPGARVTLAVLFVAELVFGVAAGGKQSFIVTILAVVIPFAGTRRGVPKGFLIVLIAVFLLLVIPFNQTYRATARNSSGTLSTSEALSVAPGIMSRTVAMGGSADALPSSFRYLLTRIREVDSPAIVMQRTPGQVGFVSPTALVAAPLMSVVPRALWPGKPILDTGYQFSQTYYQLPSSVYTSSSITPEADLYRHGGWVPVLVGMFLLGCGVRLLDHVVDVHANPHSIFLVLLLFPSLVNQENDWVGLIAGVPGAIVIWLVGIWLTFRPRHARG